jgi:DNA (cytosine-5)-methyltransferase 1
MSFRFVDLFAGIGGFHAALGALGGECVYASEWDKDAARIYERNWNLKPDGDITLAANDEVMNVPAHDVLVGGFPCQPFSKSGKQMGMEETRGTLFWNIAKIIETHKPSIVLLENVRNITGPRHLHEWEVIIQTLRDLGYRVSEDPHVVSGASLYCSNLDSQRNSELQIQCRDSRFVDSYGWLGSPIVESRKTPSSRQIEKQS